MQNDSQNPAKSCGTSTIKQWTYVSLAWRRRHVLQNNKTNRPANTMLKDKVIWWYKHRWLDETEKFCFCHNNYDVVFIMGVLSPREVVYILKLCPLTGCQYCHNSLGKLLRWNPSLSTLMEIDVYCLNIPDICPYIVISYQVLMSLTKLLKMDQHVDSWCKWFIQHNIMILNPFLCYWSPVDSPHKGSMMWSGAVLFVVCLNKLSSLDILKLIWHHPHKPMISVRKVLILQWFPITFRGQMVSLIIIDQMMLFKMLSKKHFKVNGCRDCFSTPVRLNVLGAVSWCQ